MIQARKRHLAGDAEREDGAVIVEFAAIFVVFAMLLWGLISYGLVFVAQQSLTHASSEATRAAIGAADESDARARITAVVEDELEWLDRFGGLAFDAGSEDHVSFYECDGRECLRVRVAYDWGAHPIVPSMLDVATPDRMTGNAVVQFR